MNEHTGGAREDVGRRAKLHSFIGRTANDDDHHQRVGEKILTQQSTTSTHGHKRSQYSVTTYTDFSEAVC